jgi:hypothetical protein
MNGSGYILADKVVVLAIHHQTNGSINANGQLKRSKMGTAKLLER